MISLEQWAEIAQIAEAILVVASLAYVARQLRQNTVLMRNGASSERVQREFDIVQNVIESREIAEFWMKGDSEFAGLDAVNQMRLMFFERRAIVHWHNMFGQRNQGLLSDSDWHELKWIIRNIGRRQAVREAWKMFRPAFEESFQSFIIEQFRLGDQNRPLPS